MSKKSQEKKKTVPEEEVGKKLWKTYSGKQTGGQVLSYHNFLINSKTGKIGNPPPKLEKKAAERTVRKTSKTGVKKEKMSEITVKGIYERFKNTLGLLYQNTFGQTPPQSISAIPSADLKELDEINLRGDYSIFIPLLNIYGNVDSISLFISKNITALDYVSREKLRDGSTISLNDDELKQVIAQKILSTIDYQLSLENPSKIFVTYRNIITVSNGQYYVLNENEVNFLFPENVDEDIFRDILRIFVKTLFDQGKERIEEQELIKEERGFEKYFIEELRERKINLVSMNLKEFVNLERKMIESTTSRLDIESLIALSFLSCVSSYTFEHVPSQYKKEIKVAKPTTSTATTEQEETEEEYEFARTKLKRYFEEETKDFIENGYSGRPTDFELENRDDINKIINYAHFLTFKPVSQIMNVGGTSAGSSGVSRTLLEILFLKLRQYAGFTAKKDEEEEEKKTTSSRNVVWFEDLLRGTNTLEIKDLKIERKAIQGGTKLSFTGLTKGDANTPRAFSTEADLSESEKQALRDLVNQENPDLTDAGNKRLLLRLFKSRAVLTKVTRVPRDTEEKRKARELTEANRTAALTELMEELGTTFDGLSQGSTATHNFTLKHFEQEGGGRRGRRDEE